MYLEQLSEYLERLLPYFEGPSARPEPGLARAMLVGWLKPGAPAPERWRRAWECLFQGALIGPGVGAAGGPFPHAAASSGQVIANKISAQRGRMVLYKEVVPSGLVLVLVYSRSEASGAQPVGEFYHSTGGSRLLC